MLKQTGVFEFLAIWAAKKARGRPFRLMMLPVVITAVASALLDNVTTVLLIAPVTSLVGERLALPVASFLIAETMSSNIGGTATLVGDPPPGDPRIALTAASEEAELMVIGSHGLGTGRGLLVGSVAYGVAGHASCDVVVVGELGGAAVRAVHACDQLWTTDPPLPTKNRPWVETPGRSDAAGYACIVRSFRRCRRSGCTSRTLPARPAGAGGSRHGRRLPAGWFAGTRWTERPGSSMCVRARVRCRVRSRSASWA
ncbi:universal stress protein [Spongiactinospora rosea]|uniref:universal stress protein n=1 Tax=Spongiactinospora rosea TaxID=2248750 RepID=UPI001CEC6304|nr:universal stress protein [Spongiactinospora rosea]